jgi:glycosyltransferase involved in cell wall biosynthesis
MKILVLAKQCPYPLDDGASIAIHMLSKGLVEEGAIVNLLAFNTVKHSYDGEIDIRELSHYHSIQLIDLDNRASVIGAAINLLTSQSYHVSRFRSKKMEQKLIAVLTEHSYDIVQIESSHLLIYHDLIRKHHTGKIVLRAHNVEHRIWQRYQSQLDNRIVAKYHQIQAKRLKDVEDYYARQVDSIMAVSAVDQAYFEILNPHTAVVPIGLALPSKHHHHQEVSTPKFGFIGSMDWAPNEEGLRWLLEKVIGHIDRDVEIILAGRNFDSANLTIPDNPMIKVLGDVDDVTTFWDKVDVLLVPLFSGSGTRVKIIEAFAHQKLVLTTTIGIEGIQAFDEQDALIRDGEIAWTDTINAIMDDWTSYSTVSSSGQRLAEEYYDYTKVAAAALQIYKGLTQSDRNQE